MRIFLAGASGAIGERLVPLLLSCGHEVTGTTRRLEKADELKKAGAEPVVLDVLDREGVLKAVAAARPDAVVHQVTALSSVHNLRHFDEEFAQTNRLRTEGGRNLLAAAVSAGAARFIAQSFTGWPNGPDGARIQSEEDPLDPKPPPSMTKTLDAIRGLESSVTGASGIDGVVLRYGNFYGPGTSIAPGGDIAEAVRKRRLPVIGDGAGVWSFIHLDDAAAATALSIEGVPPGIYNVVDDEPAEVAIWLPELARIMDAARPYRLPAWIGRLLVGEAVVSMMTRIRGSSNAKIKRALNWRPNYSSWRDGFRQLFEARANGQG
jgi:2-alkyl-3-oxoalkanoate reductase